MLTEERSKTVNLGSIESVGLRDVWADEPNRFTVGQRANQT